jgi:hypothetical protein
MNRTAGPTILLLSCTHQRRKQMEFKEEDEATKQTHACYAGLAVRVHLRGRTVVSGGGA